MFKTTRTKLLERIIVMLCCINKDAMGNFNQAPLDAYIENSDIVLRKTLSRLCFFENDNHTGDHIVDATRGALGIARFDSEYTLLKQILDPYDHTHAYYVYSVINEQIDTTIPESIQKKFSREMFNIKLNIFEMYEQGVDNALSEHKKTGIFKPYYPKSLPEPELNFCIHIFNKIYDYWKKNALSEYQDFEPRPENFNLDEFIKNLENNSQ